jgi:hypothetical protein
MAPTDAMITASAEMMVAIIKILSKGDKNVFSAVPL